MKDDIWPMVHAERAASIEDLEHVDLSLGDGPDVRATALALLVAASGRRVALDELDGPAVATLTERV